MAQAEAVQEDRQQYSLLRNDYFIRRVSGKFIINSIISVLFVYAGSLIDTLLVGLYLGADGLSAMSLVSPVYLFYYTVGATIGIGASILGARELGTENTDQYRRCFTCGAIALAIAAVVMIALPYLLFDPVISLLCGSVTDIRRDMAADYLRFYIPGGGCTLMTYIPLYFLKTDGRPKLSSRLFTLSAVMNVILSWLFMSPVFDMGVAGASLATSISMGTVAILGFVLMLRGHTQLKFVKGSFSFSLLGKMALAGIPNGMTNLLSSARILLINMLLISIGASSLLSCYTVVRNVSDILSSVIVGISSAIIPLVGVLFGERDYAGNRSVMKLAMKVGTCVMVPLVVIASVLAGPLMRVFGISDAAVLAEGRIAIPLACIGLIAAYSNTLYTGYLTAIKREGMATVLVILRMLGALALLAVPLAYLVGSKGIWISLSIAEAVTLGAYYLMVSIARKKNQSLDKYMIDTSLDNVGDIVFSVRNNVDDIVYATEEISKFCEDNDIDPRRSMRVSLAIEEILTFLNAHCLDQSPDSFTDVRVCKLGTDVMVRFRYVGKVYNPMDIYNSNEFYESMQEELLGLKLVTRSASHINYQLTLGANNLVIIF